MPDAPPVPSCDVCGQPILPGQPVYALAWVRDEDGRCVSGRHWSCHTPVEENLGRIRETLEGLRKRALHLRDAALHGGSRGASDDTAD